MPEQNAVERVLATFPWLAQLGLVDLLYELAVQGITGDAVLAEVRKTPQYQAMFPAIRRPDGTLRMTEAAYLQRQDEYRQAVLQFDRSGYGYDSPQDFVALFEGEVDPNEFRDRLTLYDNLKRSGQDIRDAFYIYAGIRMSDDDLYSYVVDRNFRRIMDDQYNQAVAQSPVDYETWITRATEAGLARVVQALEDLQEEGAFVEPALQRIRQVDPGFARQMMDVLFTGGQPLAFNELLNAFEMAMIGSAATAHGIRLPDKDRIQAIRQAGVDRTKALEAYGRFARDRNALEAMVQRASAGRIRRLTADDFERAVFLHEAEPSRLLQRAEAQERALGRASGAFGFDQNGPLIRQSGMRSPLMAR